MAIKGPTVTSVGDLLGFHQVMFTRWKPGVWQLNCIYKVGNGGTAQLAYCSDDIAKQWLALHFSTEELRGLIDG